MDLQGTPGLRTDVEEERWKKFDRLVDAALELPREERGRFLAAECAGDDELRREAESFLDAHERRAPDFMEQPAISIAARGLAREAHAGGKPGATRVGFEVGPYRVERLLGAGGMGEVYLALDTRLGRRVALKILPARFTADAERVARFEREARAVSSLNHPNIVTVYDVGSGAEGLHFIATEYVEGRTLRELAAAPPPLKEVLSIAAQAAEALAAAHGAGVVHRDVKPDNVMARADGYVKVLDFGLAKLVEAGDAGPRDDAARTAPGAVMGTARYMSPEQAAGERLDARTDLWSLGCVIYELATGVSPFARADRVATLNAILNEEPEPVTKHDPGLPAEIDRILSKALEKDRELRYQTASDLRADLRRLQREVDSLATWSDDRAAATGPAEPRRRRWALPAAAGVLLLVVAGVAAWWWSARRAAAPDWSRATHTQLTDRDGVEHFPALSPDGRAFVYASDEAGNYDIFAQRVGGKNRTNLTADSAADDTQPAFSPDGNSIAFRSEREPPGLYVMGATGENVRRIADGGFHPSWSPDGKELVFSERGRVSPSTRNAHPSALWVVNVETGAKRQLAAPGDAMQPAWSPSGARVAFWFIPPGVGRSDIATMPSAGGEAVVVTRDAATNWNPVWSPDGRYLYFASDRRGQMNFWRVRVEEQTGAVLSGPEAVVTPSTFSSHLAFSRDGRRMIYVQTDSQTNLQAVGFDAQAERVSGEPTWVTRGDRQVSRPELSPDGARFVMRLARRTQDDIVTVSRDGRDWRDLTDDRFFDRYPRWSPDGRRIAFTSDRGGAYEIWTIDADGANLRQVTAGGETDTSFPLWSPDGRRLLYRAAGFNYVIDPAAGAPSRQRLPPSAGLADEFVAWDWSPDGTKLCGSFARAGSATGTGYYSFETNRYERLADYGAQPAWLPDSRRFVLTHEGRAFVADTATGKVRELLPGPPGHLRSIGVSRNGLLLYFTVPSTESDIWLSDLE
jgi:Tol biopolymer transport system component